MTNSTSMSASRSMPAVLTPTAAAELLSELGFLHVAGPPYVVASAYLMVALRMAPTLDHFDPERVDYWFTTDGRNTLVSLDHSSRPATSAYAWGELRVVDRLGKSNNFLSFGGKLALDRFDKLRVAVFSSPAPIIVRGGHSQETEGGAPLIEAFFARIRAFAGESRAVEAEISALSPEARYAWFLAETLTTYEQSGALPTLGQDSLNIFRRERNRLELQRPAEWAAGLAFAQRVEQAKTKG